MTITLVGTAGVGVTTGSPTLTLPPGIAFGDAVGAIGVCSTSQTLTAPAGWTVQSGWPKDGGSARFYTWTKDAVTASDSGASFVFTSSADNKVVVVGFALHSGNGFPTVWTDALNFTAHTVTGTAYTAPSSTSTAAGDWGVACFGVRGTINTAADAAWTPATGLTERQDLARTGTGATSLHLCDSAGSVGAASTVWGPFTESNISASSGGGLTWLVKENATGGGGGGGGGGGLIYPKCGLWIEHDSGGGSGAWRTRHNFAEATYGPVQGHWGHYSATGTVPLSAEVETALSDGKRVHQFWKPMATSGSGSTWADVAAGLRDTQIDAFAADVVAAAPDPGQLWVTVHHEPEDDYIAHGSGGVGWTAANYRGMWQRVRARFDAAGASQYVTWVLVYQHSHSHPAEMITLYGNDSVMDGLVDILSQQDYIVSTTTPSTLATKWIEDLEWARTNESTGRKWGYLNKRQAFTEWGADLGGAPANRGTNLHRAQTIDAIRGILPDLASRNVVELRYFDDGSNDIDFPPSVDGVAFQALKDATEAGQQAPPVSVAGVALANDGLTTTSTSIPFTLPSGWAQGDYALALLVSNGTPSISTTPAGWSLRDGPTDTGAANGRAWVYQKFLAAGEANPTWTISAAQRPSGVLLLLRGVDAANPVHAAQVLVATSPATTHAAPAVATTATQAFILTAWLVRWSDASGNGGVNYGTVPASHTSDGTVSVNSGASSGSGGLVAHLTASPVGPGSHGSYTATFPVSCTGLVTQLALLPAGVADTRQLAEAATGTDTLSVATGAVAKTLTDAGAASDSMSVAASGAPAVGFPTQKVEVAFASQPMATSPVWTDITSFVRWPIERTYGRGDELSEVAPGTIRLRLANADGRFTLGRTAGPYGTGVKIGRRLRWSETFNGVNYVRFDGHVDGWPTAWTTNSTRDAEAQITATDRLKRFGQIGELRSLLEEEVLRDSSAPASGMVPALSLSPDQTDTAIGAELDHLVTLGVRRLWLVGAFEWASTGSGTWDATAIGRYDAVINGAAARGMQVILQAHGMPTWITTASGHTANTWHGPDTAGERSDWVGVLHNFIARYGSSKFSHIEIWNEPDNGTAFWVQGANAADYVRLLRDCYVDIKASWPALKVVGHNMARSHIGWLQTCYTQTDTIFGAGTAAANHYYFDVLGVHPYCGNSTSGYDPTDTSHADETTSFGTLGPDFLDYRRLRDEVVAKEGSSKNLGFGEFGYAIQGTGWFKVAEGTRAGYMASAVALAAADGYVDYFNPYYHRANETPSDYATSFNIHGTSTETSYAAAVAPSTGTLGITGAYYPLSESSDAQTVASITATPWGAGVITQAGSGGTLELGAGTGPGTDGLPAAVFARVNRQNGKYLAAHPIGVGTATAVTLECFFATTATDAPICALTRTGEGLTLFVDDPTGRIVAYYENASGLQYGRTTTGVYNDGHTHHLAITLQRSGSTVTADLYVDGVRSAAGSGTFVYKSLPVFTRLDIGGSHVQHTVGVYSGTLSHVAAYSTALSAARVLAHYQAGATGLAGERTDQRLGRLAGYIAIPSADRAFDTGDKTVGAQSTSGKQPLAAMQEVEAAEQGVLFVNGSGKLAFHKRSRRYNTTPALTLDAAAGRIQVGLSFPGDDFGLVNDMTVTRPGGGGGRAVNQASIDEHGLFRDSLEVPAATDDAAAQVAQWRVNTYGEPRARIPNLTVSLRRLAGQDPAAVAALLNADISTHLRLTNLPAQAPASTLDVFAEGWTERLDRRSGEWTLELNCSPADVGKVWQLGVSGLSELGVTTRLAL